MSSFLTPRAPALRQTPAAAGRFEDLRPVAHGVRSRRSDPGLDHTPLGAWYHGTKFALGDCLRIETKPFGIDVVMIEPDAIRTEWAGIAADHLVETSGHGAYADQADAVATAFRSEATAKRSSPPEIIAEAVTKAASARRPKTRYAVGSGAKPLIFMHRWLPDRAYDAVIRRISGLR